MRPDSFNSDTSAKIFIQSFYGDGNTFVSNSYLGDYGLTSITIGSVVYGKRKVFYLNKY